MSLVEIGSHLPVTALNFDISNRWLLAGSGTSIFVYDTHHQYKLHIHCQRWAGELSVVHGIVVTSVSDKDDEQLVCVFGDRSVRLFLLQVTADEARLEPVGPTYRQSFLVLEAVLQNLTGEIVLWLGYANNSVSMWSVRRDSGQNYSVTPNSHYQCEETALLYCMGITTADRQSVTVASGTMYSVILLWRPEESTEVKQRLLGHHGEICGLRWDTQGMTLASVSADRSVRVWEYGRSIGNSQYLAYKTSGDAIAASRRFGTEIDCTAAIRPKGKSHHLSETNRITDEYRHDSSMVLKWSGYAHSARVWVARFCGDQLLSGGEDGKCCIWQLSNGEYQTNLSGHTPKHIWSMAVCNLGENSASSVVATGGGDGGIQIWSLQNASDQTSITSAACATTTDAAIDALSYRGCVLYAHIPTSHTLSLGQMCHVETPTPRYWTIDENLANVSSLLRLHCTYLKCMETQIDDEIPTKRRTDAFRFVKLLQDCRRIVTVTATGAITLVLVHPDSRSVTSVCIARCLRRKMVSLVSPAEGQNVLHDELPARVTTAALSECEQLIATGTADGIVHVLCIGSLTSSKMVPDAVHRSFSAGTQRIAFVQWAASVDSNVHWLFVGYAGELQQWRVELSQLANESDGAGFACLERVTLYASYSIPAKVATPSAVAVAESCQLIFVGDSRGSITCFHQSATEGDSAQIQSQWPIYRASSVHARQHLNDLKILCESKNGGISQVELSSCGADGQAVRIRFSLKDSASLELAKRPGFVRCGFHNRIEDASNAEIDSLPCYTIFVNPSTSQSPKDSSLHTTDAETDGIPISKRARKRQQKQVRLQEGADQLCGYGSSNADLVDKSDQSTHQMQVDPLIERDKSAVNNFPDIDSVSCIRLQSLRLVAQSSVQSAWFPRQNSTDSMQISGFHLNEFIVTENVGLAQVELLRVETGGYKRTFDFFAKLNSNGLADARGGWMLVDAPPPQSSHARAVASVYTEKSQVHRKTDQSSTLLLRVFQQTPPLSRSVKLGSHGRVVAAVGYLPYNQMTSHQRRIVSAGEDYNACVWQNVVGDATQFVPTQPLTPHVTIVNAVASIADSQTMLCCTAGGRETAIFWNARDTNNEFTWVCTYRPSNAAVDQRFTDVSLISLEDSFQSDKYTGVFVALCANTDGEVAVILVDMVTRRCSLHALLSVSNSPVLCCATVTHSVQHSYFFTGSSNGKVTAYALQNIIHNIPVRLEALRKLSTTSDQEAFPVIDTYDCHSSCCIWSTSVCDMGVNTMDTGVASGNTGSDEVCILIACGGDDGALGLCRWKCSHADTTYQQPTSVLLQGVGASALRGIRMINDKLFTVSLDQRLNVWQVTAFSPENLSLFSDRLEASIENAGRCGLSLLWSAVVQTADVMGLDATCLCHDTKNEYEITVCGAGLQHFRLTC